MESPFHAGERSLQERTGLADRIEEVGRKIIRDHMPDDHRELFAALPFLAIGSLDTNGRPWASIVAGRPGFATSPDPKTLRVDAMPPPGDPLRANLAGGAPVGVLGIQLATRRRNRMNGRLAEVGAEGFSIRVDQSFGNCPKYIQARDDLAPAASPPPAVAHAEEATLSDRARRLVANADTFFIATASADARSDRYAEGVDVSHRGGRPGFVRIDAASGRAVLTIPDFVGNMMFQTLGNLAVNPRAGLVFVDFDAGHLLQLTGTAEAIFDGAELAAFAGAERLLRFQTEAGVFLEHALALRWSAPRQARQLEATGVWSEAASR